MKRYLTLFLLLLSLHPSLSYSADDTSRERVYKKLSNANNLFTDFLQNINSNYAIRIDPELLTFSMLQEGLKILDPYSFIYKVDDEKFSDNIYLKDFYGYGFNYDTLDKKLYILDLIQNSAARKSGIKVGDIIKKVNGYKIEDINYNIGSLLDTAKSKKVTLELYRECSDSNFTITMEKQKVPPAPILFTPIPNTDYYYLSFTSFFENAAEKVNKKLKSANLTKNNTLIIDLRGNPGGLMGEAIKLLNLFISDTTTVCSVIGQKNEVLDAYNLPNSAPYEKIPIVILINKNSASSSEIFAAIMQEYDRATIVGEPSLGKGLVQNTFDLRNGYELRLTTGRYLTSNGRWLQHFNFADKFYKDDYDSTKVFYSKSGRILHSKKGVEPDIFISDNDFSPLIQDLLNSKAFFYYINQINCNLKIVNPKSKMSIDFDNFLKFLDTHNFYKETSLYKRLKSFLNYKENYNSSTTDNKFDELPAKETNEIIQFIRNELIQNKNEIEKLIQINSLQRVETKEDFAQIYYDFDILIQKTIELIKQNKTKIR
jgi:carboxyl-terminal processing protease